MSIRMNTLIGAMTCAVALSAVGCATTRTAANTASDVATTAEQGAEGAVATGEDVVEGAIDAGEDIAEGAVATGTEVVETGEEAVDGGKDMADDAAATGAEALEQGGEAAIGALATKLGLEPGLVRVGFDAAKGLMSGLKGTPEEKKTAAEAGVKATADHAIEAGTELGESQLEGLLAGLQKLL